jgi:hypothetical protein
MMPLQPAKYPKGPLRPWCCEVLTGAHPQRPLNFAAIHSVKYPAFRSLPCEASLARHGYLTVSQARPGLEEVTAA